MFFHDHLLPHFHAEYGEFKAKLTIENGEVIDGKLPRRALRLIQDWTELHKAELMENYHQSQIQGGVLRKIEPLQ